MPDLKIIIGNTRPGRAADRVIRNSVVIPFADAFGADGQPVDPRTSPAARILPDDLAWRATTLRRAAQAGAGK